MERLYMWSLAIRASLLGERVSGWGKPQSQQR